MRKYDIVEKIKSIIAQQLEIRVENVTGEARFSEDLGIDSLDTVALFTALEEEFHIEIPDADKMKLITVNDLIEYAQARV